MNAYLIDDGIDGVPRYSKVNNARSTFDNHYRPTGKMKFEFEGKEYEVEEESIVTRDYIESKISGLNFQLDVWEKIAEKTIERE